MGYACYDTPRGEAGYGVIDTCHEENCEAGIDRGLGQLCGSTPGEADEHGCGWWFCDEHLYFGQPGSGYYKCLTCYKKDDNDD